MRGARSICFQVAGRRAPAHQITLGCRKRGRLLSVIVADRTRGTCSASTNIGRIMSELWSVARISDSDFFAAELQTCVSPLMRLLWRTDKSVFHWIYVCQKT